jgi:hypothetical protein
LAHAGIEYSQDTTKIIRDVEEKLSLQPEDDGLQALLVMAFDHGQAHEALDVAPYGLHRTTLIGWDRWSTTWLGHDIATGRCGKLRILRPDCRSHPVALRVLERDARRLFPVLPALKVYADALTICLSDDDKPQPERPLFLSLIVTHSRWATHGLGWPQDLSHALHVGPAGLEILCLTPEPTRAGPDAWEHLTRWLNTRYDLEHVENHEPLLRTLTSMRGGRPDETLRAALKQELVRQWHALRTRRTEAHTLGRAQRLNDLLDRLHHATPPPQGRAAVGVSPDGTLTMVQSDGSTLSWGTEEDTSVIAHEGQPIDAPAGRQLLRARAMGVPSEHLQAQAGGDASYLFHATAWVASALKLRTLRLLLRRQVGR